MTFSPGRAALVAVLALLVVAGCATVEEAPRLAAPADAAAGDVVTVAIPPPRSVDPGNAHDPVGTMIAGAVCDSLVGVDPETGELVPAIAESWTVTDDGRRVMLRLREGIHFPDGEELTAADVVFSLSRAASAAYAGQAADLLAPIQGYREIRGQVVDAPQHMRERLSGVQQLTKYTVQITLRGPLDQGGSTASAGAEFVKVLTHPVAAPISRSAAEADPQGVAQQPVCVGPYELADPWHPDDRTIRLVRVEEYYGLHGGFTNGGSGYADEIVMHVLPELDPGTRPPPAPADDEPDDGDEDSSQPDDADLGEPEEPAEPEVAPPPLDGFDIVLVAPLVAGVLDDEPRLERVTAPGPGIEFVGLPVEGPEFTTDADGEERPTGREQISGRELRIALSEAIDRRHIAETIFDGARAPAGGFLPRTLGTSVYREHACGPHTPETGDVTSARARLTSAGISLRGQVLELPFNDDYRNRALMEEVARQWEEAFGLTVRLRPLSWEDYLSEVTAVGGPAGAFRASWSVPYPDIDRYLYPLFHTSGIGQANWSGFSDPAFDELITEHAREATDPDDRILLYHELEEMLCAQMPLIPLVEQRTVLGVRVDRVASAHGAFAGGPRGEALLREIYVPSSG